MPTRTSSWSSSLAWVIDLVALVLSGTFAGAALHFTLVQQPARMRLCSRDKSPACALMKWKRSGDLATARVEASLAALTVVMGGVGAWMGKRDLCWLLGCVLTGFTIPVTMAGIVPLNDRLELRAVRALEEQQHVSGKGKEEAAAAVEEGHGAAAVAAERDPCPFLLRALGHQRPPEHHCTAPGVGDGTRAPHRTGVCGLQPIGLGGGDGKAAAICLGEEG